MKNMWPKLRQFPERPSKHLKSDSALFKIQLKLAGNRSI
jgi:hypothetical protein